jgi:hypothetical protein
MGKFKFVLNTISDQAYPNLKAGEQNVPRDYYAAATNEKPNGEKCLTNYNRFSTDYR